MLFHLIEDLIRNISGGLGRSIRRAYYKFRLGKLGKNCNIDQGVYFQSPKDIFIGNDSWIDKRSIFIAGKLDRKNVKRLKSNITEAVVEGQIHIGPNAHIGPGTVIQGHGGVRIASYFASSTYSNFYSLTNNVRSLHCVVGGQDKDYILTPIFIGSNVLFGLNATMIGGKVGDNCFIKPYSMLTGNFSDNTIIGGNPAKEIDSRYRDLKA